MIHAGADAARRTGTRWHIHLAEEKYQVDDARAKYGTTPLRAIEKMGLLDRGSDRRPRLLVRRRRARAARRARRQARLQPELQHVPRRRRHRRRRPGGARCARWRSAPTAAARTRGSACSTRCAPARCCRRWARRRGAPDAGQAIDAETVFTMGTAWGGEVLGLPIGRLAVGQRADVVFVDLDDPSLWPEQSLRQERRLFAVGARDHRRLRRGRGGGPRPRAGAGGAGRGPGAGARADPRLDARLVPHHSGFDWYPPRIRRAGRGATTKEYSLYFEEEQRSHGRRGPAQTGRNHCGEVLARLALLDQRDDLDVPGLRHHVDRPDDAAWRSRGGTAPPDRAPASSDRTRRRRARGRERRQRGP